MNHITPEGFASLVAYARAAGATDLRMAEDWVGACLRRQPQDLREAMVLLDNPEAMADDIAAVAELPR